MRMGPDALADRELLALVLRSGTRGESVLDLADSLLSVHSGVDGLATAHSEELARRSGIGPAKATAIVAAFELGRRAVRSFRAGRALRSGADVAAAAHLALNWRRRERTVVLVCNGANQLKTTIVVSEGSIDRSLMPVREILNAVLRHDGRSFALAHNHPSGDPTPSESDRQATADVAEAARTVGLRFLGHIVVAGDRWEDATATPTHRTYR